MTDFELVDVDGVSPSTYNPRKADKERLALLDLSLRKLGFLSPIVATRGGEIMSGHQRQFIARSIGMTQVPVHWTKPMSLADRKAINIAFNRGTNDLDRLKSNSDLRREILSIDFAGFEDMPDVHLSDRAFPCMQREAVDLRQVGKDNAALFNASARNSARLLIRKGFDLPIVMCEGRVVNGIGRVQYLLESGATEAKVVQITSEQERLADAMLNLLSMDFNIHERYEDDLRHNSFRRSRNQRSVLGSGFMFFIPGSGSKWDVRQPSNAAKWKRAVGSTVVDFGAGHLQETNILRSIGVDVTPFEPYRQADGNQIDKEQSVETAKGFLAAVATGKKFDGFFVSNVFNSVPFHFDRRVIACIAAATCGDYGTAYACTMGTKHPHWQSVCGRDYVNKNNSNNNKFKLEYEGGILLGDFGDRPKVQKYHTLEEFRGLFTEFFDEVQSGYWGANVWIKARGWSRSKTLSFLRKALCHEFELPYPDGTRMGMSQEALEAFGKRIGEALL